MHLVAHRLMFLLQRLALIKAKKDRQTLLVERVTFLAVTPSWTTILQWKNEQKCAPHQIQLSIQVDYCSGVVLQ